MSKKTQTQRVLEKLRDSAGQGITALDFATGFALRSRISDLRALGNVIHSRKDESLPLWRYWLISEAGEVAA